VLGRKRGHTLLSDANSGDEWRVRREGGWVREKERERERERERESY